MRPSLSRNSVLVQWVLGYGVQHKFSLGSGNDSYNVFFSYTILATPEVEPHAPYTYNSNKEGSTSRP